MSCTDLALAFQPYAGLLRIKSHRVQWGLFPRIGMGNLWLTVCCLTPTPISPIQHGQQSGGMGTAVHQHLVGTMLTTSTLENITIHLCIIPPLCYLVLENVLYYIYCLYSSLSEAKILATTTTLGEFTYSHHQNQSPCCKSLWICCHNSKQFIKFII